ncbi:MAG TPA: hypothetical protein VIN75_26085 [Burkholderiaceae bacterium]
MAVEVIEWVFKHSRSKNGARLTLLAIADACHSPEGTGAWPSMAELVEKTQLSERAVHDAIAVCVKLGELWVGLNQGPKGCNRYAVLMTGAKSAPPQNLHPAKSAPPAESAPVHAPESSQVVQEKGADSAPPADIAPPQNLHPGGADSAPGTVREPSVDKEEGTTSPPTRRRGAKRPPANTVAARFDDFWGVYPKREGKGAAEKAWTRAINTIGADPQAVIDAALEYAQKRKGQDPQFTKQPATWLNARCWEDEPAPAYADSGMIPGFQAPRPNGYQPYRNPENHDVYDAWMG